MGNLYIVATPIGNMSDITLRAIEVLKNVDYILAEDTRNTLKILNKYDIKKHMLSYHKFNEKKRSMEVIEQIKEGNNFALVTDCGTPCISDPGYILVNECRKEEIEVIAIPGASAAISALSISGIDSSKFTFIGFLPQKKADINKIIDNIKKSEIKTYIFYESPKRIVNLIACLNNAFENSIVSICSDITKIHERVIYGKIDEVYEKIKIDDKIEKGEYVIILEKTNKVKNTIDTNISLEAILIDYMIRNKVTLKEAIEGVSKEQKNLSKKDVYQASLNLKKLI